MIEDLILGLRPSEQTFEHVERRIREELAEISSEATEELRSKPGGAEFFDRLSEWLVTLVRDPQDPLEMVALPDAASMLFEDGWNAKRVLGVRKGTTDEAALSLDFLAAYMAVRDVQEEWVRATAESDMAIIEFEKSKRAFNALTEAEWVSRRGLDQMRDMCALFAKADRLWQSKLAVLDKPEEDPLKKDRPQMEDTRLHLQEMIEEQTRKERSDRIRERRSREVEKVSVDTSCSVEECSRSRSFFDEVGNGYCKRHAEERGLRPHGKA